MKENEPFCENKASEQRKVSQSSESSSESDQNCGNFIHGILDINVLGRHGGELLSELRSSTLSPSIILGCICMGTEVNYIPKIQTM